MITHRVRPDLMRDVVDLEDDQSLVIITLPVPMYKSKIGAGMTDEEIYRELSKFHDNVDRLENPVYEKSSYGGTMVCK